MTAQTSPRAIPRSTPTLETPGGRPLELVDPPWSLSGEINRLIDEGRIVDPREIAGEVLDTIPESHLDTIVRQLLISAVRDVIRSRRATPVTGAGSSAPGSARWAQAAESLQRKLNTQLWTANGWKRHRDCTVEDLLSVVSHHEAIASQNAVLAERYDRQAKAMKKAKAKAFGDLPDSVIEGLL